jgi:hypothetical protein
MPLLVWMCSDRDALLGSWAAVLRGCVCLAVGLESGTPLGFDVVVGWKVPDRGAQGPSGRMNQAFTLLVRELTGASGAVHESNDRPFITWRDVQRRLA